MSPKQTRWKKSPEEANFSAARLYLSLLLRPEDVDVVVAALRSAPQQDHDARDMLRAGALPILPKGEPHVAKDLRRIGADKALPPVLIIRGDLRTSRLITIADGYHRVCACCHIDDNATVCCRIVDLDL
jgi:hypothetical protein